MNDMGKRGNHWKGGRSLASNGYVLVWVGKDHHLADVRGYAYEHRLVAEQKLGRHLLKGEVPHHINAIRADNRPENIEIVDSCLAHGVRHRVVRSSRRLPHQANEMIACACGCGAMFRRFDNSGRPRSFVTGHNTAHADDGRWQPVRLPENSR